MKKIILSITAGFATLSLGLAIFYTGQFLVSIFQTQEVEAVELIPNVSVEPQEIPVEDLVYPKVSQIAENFENDGEIFYYGGEYLIIGTIAEGFEDCEYLKIKTEIYKETTEENSLKSILIPPTGEFVVGDEKHIEFERMFIANRQIAFQTETKHGISYQFTGKFSKQKEVKIGEYTYYSVLEGKLTKIKNGQQIAFTDVNFESLPGC